MSYEKEQITFRITNLSELKKLLEEASDLAEQLETKLQEINSFEIEMGSKARSGEDE